MRSCGILLPVSSLPSSYGIGGFGKEAYHFIDQLKNAGQKFWQVLPLGGTSYGDSPYQAFSTFAGNPYFVDLETLITEGLLTGEECEELPYGSEPAYVDYEKIYNSRFKLLRLAFSRYNKKKRSSKYLSFTQKNEYWLPDYALFMALKDHHKGASFFDWEKPIKFRKPKALEKYKQLLAEDIDFYCFIQFKFFEQWGKVKKYAHKNNVKIIGDIPIYVALDSADTWSRPELFEFDKELCPTAVAGCPPDYFAKTGQLWGNPLYDWKKHKQTKYDWWIKRISAASEMYDTVRIDHFRGFSEYYSIPATEKTAENGSWIIGPGIAFFQYLKKQLGRCSIIAEDLGFLTDQTRKMLKQSGYPGMKILQFGLYANSDSAYLPYKYHRNCVCYTGTHDNQTTTSWLAELKEEDKKFLLAYLAKEEVDTYDIIALGLSSVADLTIVPMQDYLELDDSARMNIPSTIGGNWEWRLTTGQFDKVLEEKIAGMARIYGRVV